MQTRHVLTFPPTLAAFQHVGDDLRRALDDNAVPNKVRYNVELVVEEIATNIIRHSRASDESEVVLSLELGESVVLTVEDSGMPFDPTQQPDPKAPDSIDTAKVGGLGLVLVRKASKRIEYERTATQRNRLTVTISAN
jgi:anti-sigma regulatory factor (Ser/Thr protein kinase)